MLITDAIHIINNQLAEYQFEPLVFEELHTRQNDDRLKISMTRYGHLLNGITNFHDNANEIIVYKTQFVTISEQALKYIVNEFIFRTELLKDLLKAANLSDIPVRNLSISYEKGPKSAAIEKHLLRHLRQFEFSFCLPNPENHTQIGVDLSGASSAKLLHIRDVNCSALKVKTEDEYYKQNQTEKYFKLSLLATMPIATPGFKDVCIKAQKKFPYKQPQKEKMEPIGKMIFSPDPDKKMPAPVEHPIKIERSSDETTRFRPALI